MKECDTDRQVLQTFLERFQTSIGDPAPDMRLIVDVARVLRPRAGDVLFSAGDLLEDLYFVVSGLVRYYYLTPHGREFNKNFVSSGGVVTCLSSFLAEKPSPFFTEALEDTVLVSVPMETVRRLKADDILWERVFNGFITRLALRKEQREASFLLEDAAGRYEAFLREYSQVALRLPQYHIASYLGITPVALSRIRARRAKRSAS
ncbi:MAG: Crp/Fnr family transcriptional regulator [Roseibium sp.]|uniref:Crp/Fnr family transcriptional regulator n=1 Tax=Roseibium sp. TaxID=1936156 RepID=UPI002615EED5|nr:Crp/Fnr family transcriptional regulator [Roseibium sp.]MCV0429233.1 Crp/Fnr family transcriptional regulator [Roseibium sp.]